jgi:hypothetical protein
MIHDMAAFIVAFVLFSIPLFARALQATLNLLTEVVLPILAQRES